MTRSPVQHVKGLKPGVRRSIKDSRFNPSRTEHPGPRPAQIFHPARYGYSRGKPFFVESLGRSVVKIHVIARSSARRLRRSSNPIALNLPDGIEPVQQAVLDSGVMVVRTVDSAPDHPAADTAGRNYLQAAHPVHRFGSARSIRRIGSAANISFLQSCWPVLSGRRAEARLSPRPPK